MKNTENETRMFGFSVLGVTDLNGDFTPFNLEDPSSSERSFTPKYFANSIYKTASKSIELDQFLRDLHANGKAEITEQIAAELQEAVSRIWGYTVLREVNLLIEKSR